MAKKPSALASIFDDEAEEPVPASTPEPVFRAAAGGSYATPIAAFGRHAATGSAGAAQQPSRQEAGVDPYSRGYASRASPA